MNDPPAFSWIHKECFKKRMSSWIHKECFKKKLAYISHSAFGVWEKKRFHFIDKCVVNQTWQLKAGVNVKVLCFLFMPLALTLSVSQCISFLSASKLSCSGTPTLKNWMMLMLKTMATAKQAIQCFYSNVKAWCSLSDSLKFSPVLVIID